VSIGKHQQPVKLRSTQVSNREFGIIEAAKGLARNPLGIIALFIVLVYGFASLVTGFSSAFSREERLPLIYFLVIFPILVLIVFAWLVSAHSGKLFSPGDFKDEENYVRMQLSAVASLTAAASKGSLPQSDSEISKIVEVVQQTAPHKSLPDGWRNHVLWVDDRPENNTYERRAFEAIGLKFTLALSTDEALNIMRHQRFAAVISDMGRKEGPREGYALLDTMRRNGDSTPLYIYAGSNAVEHKREAQEHGGQGCTNNAQELFQMVTRGIIGGDK
jgi:CheY-like chemotaxis protein